MPYLIDGNNLLFALKEAGCDAGRSGLCALLGKLARTDRVKVVFDGPPLPPSAGERAPAGVEVKCSGRQTADKLIIAEIDANTAPRRLTVVSTDREIRKAARRRRCGVALSEDFAKDLLRAPKERPEPVEPREKWSGLTGQEQAKWLREFGIHDADEEEQP